MKKEKPPRKPEGGQADIQPEEEPLWKTHRDGDEYARCAADPFYYVERYVHIECPEAQTLLQPFRLWPAQRPALEAMATRRRVMVLKARQLGMTWLALAEASRLLLCRLFCRSFADTELFLAHIGCHNKVLVMIRTLLAHQFIVQVSLVAALYFLLKDSLAIIKELLMLCICQYILGDKLLCTSKTTIQVNGTDHCLQRVG